MDHKRPKQPDSQYHRGDKNDVTLENLQKQLDYHTHLLEL